MFVPPKFGKNWSCSLSEKIKNVRLLPHDGGRKPFAIRRSDSESKSGDLKTGRFDINKQSVMHTSLEIVRLFKKKISTKIVL